MAQTLTGPIDAGQPDGPLRPAVASVTLADMTGGDATITPPARRVRAHVAGTLKVDYAAKAKDGSLITDTITLQADAVLDIVITKIYQSGTSATGITVFW